MNILLKIILFSILLNNAQLKANINYEQLSTLKEGIGITDILITTNTNSSKQSDIVDLYLLLSVANMFNISFENMQDFLLDIHNNKINNPKLIQYKQEDTLALSLSLLKDLKLNDEECELYSNHCQTINSLIETDVFKNQNLLLSYYADLSLTRADLSILILNELNILQNNKVQ